MIDAEGVTALWAGSPAMVRALDAVLTARPDLDARSLTVIVYGWAALPPATLASMKRHCGDDLCVFEIFGQTESISCHRFWPDEWPELYAATAPQQNYVGVLAQHPDVAKAAVIGLPHPRWSEAVTAVVVLRDGADASEEDLIKHCRASLAGYETPKSVVFAADLPETVGGKVLKYRLRTEHAGRYRDASP